MFAFFVRTSLICHAVYGMKVERVEPFVISPERARAFVRPLLNELTAPLLHSIILQNNTVLALYGET